MRSIHPPKSRCQPQPPSPAALLVYPPSGGAIDAGTANAPVTILAGGGATFWKNTTTQWYSE
ncbi:hypothetical protein AAC691_13005 [Nguyenibacter vanlangensis]|uniref:Uncharacterized protein n=1 Tax=Nguyenibacter vanlangensis TaxID=1216886 RepID=A0ABZ3D0W5_9PROT